MDRLRADDLVKLCNAICSSSIIIEEIRLHEMTISSNSASADTVDAKAPPDNRWTIKRLGLPTGDSPSRWCQSGAMLGCRKFFAKPRAV